MKFLLIALTAGLALTASRVQADDPAVPGAGFPSSRYEALWAKSPFAVATAEEVTGSSPDYELVGIAANVDGVSYASLIGTQNQEHFLISTDKATRGLTLTSITRSHDGSDTYAIVQKDGQSITLKLQQPPPTAGLPGMAGGSGVSAPAGMTSQIPIPIPMPGSNFPTPSSRYTHPFNRFHRATIHLPQMPPQQPSMPMPPSAAPPPPPQ